jgi:hypothetical protein
MTDPARDMIHAGPKSHEALATAYWEKFLLREVFSGPAYTDPLSA